MSSAAKAASYLKSPFIRIGGSFYRPPYVARVQTDGSFKPTMSRTSAVLFTNYDWKGALLRYDAGFHKNSTEAEWESVCNGLKYSMYRKEMALQLENDNLGIIQCITMQRRPKKERFGWYYDEVYSLSKEFEWLGLRWVPREYNVADILFRKKFGPTSQENF